MGSPSSKAVTNPRREDWQLRQSLSCCSDEPAKDSLRQRSRLGLMASVSIMAGDVWQQAREQAGQQAEQQAREEWEQAGEQTGQQAGEQAGQQAGQQGSRAAGT